MSPIHFFLISTIIGSAFGFQWAIGFYPEPDILSCMPDKKFHIVDWSDVKLLSDSKVQKVYFNGTLKYLKDVSGVIALNFTSERFHHGQWIPGEFKFYKDDYCKFINDPLGQPVFYMLYKKAFKQSTCPYKAGHVETFNMYPWTETPMSFPPQFMDEWRFYLRFYKHGELFDCFFLEGEIID